MIDYVIDGASYDKLLFIISNENEKLRQFIIHDMERGATILKASGMYTKEDKEMIDMDTLCMGHPVFELGSMFNAFIGYSELDHQVTMNFFGYPHEAAEKFWDMSLKLYLGTEDEAVCQSVAEKAMIIGYTRMLRRAIRRPHEAESPAKIARCKEMLAYLLNKVDTLIF